MANTSEGGFDNARVAAFEDFKKSLGEYGCAAEVREEEGGRLVIGLVAKLAGRLS